ncbi:sensor histidine kinase [Aridibaculum aurantiacum]|uniref:sensor histidine kinase n=1 Tax=Aridibaculum aurantiacum TaxID=2810307 RepID=UPI001A9652D8|nr:sensor histidine kinase [Aridibaculum aurantiacum]
MKPSLKHITVVILLLAALHSIAQPFSFKPFVVTDDGNAPRIHALHYSAKGYMLVGTSMGLFRFDGQNFHAIPFADSIVSTAVTAISEDKAGTVWLGLQNGMIAYSNMKQVSLLKAEEGHPQVSITSIVTDSSTIYFATAGEGIYYYRNKRFYNINTDDGLSDNYVYQLLLHPDGILAATDRGINTIRLSNNQKVIKPFTSANGLPDNIVRSLYTTSGDCWLGMQDKGIGRFRPREHDFFSPDLLLPWKYGQVNSILAQQEQIWVATEDEGIAAIHFADTFLTKVVHVQASAGFGKAGNLLQDIEGNIWFTSNSQLVRTPGTQLQLIAPLTEQEFTEAHTIYSDSKQNIWINNNRGLKRYSLDSATGTWKWKNFPIAAISATTDITAIYEDMYGHIWMGTMGKGVFIIDPMSGQSRNLTEDHLLVDGSVLSINGKGNQVWISSLGGAVLCRLTEKNLDIKQPYQFENYNRLSGIGSNYIYSIMVDSKNRVWFATDGKGVTVMNNGRYENFGEKQGIKHLVAYSLCEDLLGNIWFSTLGGGLYVFDGHSFKNISVEQGLNDATINALSLDKKGNLVAISRKGINLVDVNTHAVSYIDDNQGLQELNTDLNCISSYNGNVYFISKQGIISYTASYQTLQPRVSLARVTLFEKDIDIATENVFAHDENNISFYFSGISFSHPDKVRYQLKLEGYSTDWINTKENYINFPRLPAGTYTFKVRASLNQQFHEQNEASYTFTIKKPLWLQPWFIILVLLLISGGLYWFIKNREQRLKRWERLEKEKIQSQFETLKSQVNPHFLFNSFNTLISVIEENPGSAVTYVEHLSDLYRKIVTYRDKDTISLEEELQLIKDYFFIQQKRFGNNLQLQVNIPPQLQKVYAIAPLTLQLLCENAVKHNAITPASPLVITISVVEEKLLVHNNINPKYNQEKGAGMGLQNIQKRYALLSRKEIKIEHTDQHFLVHIPLLLA